MREIDIGNDFQLELSIAKVRYGFLYFPFLVLICISQLLTAFACSSASKYNLVWLDTLKPFKNAYKCTSQAVWIDLAMLDADYNESRLRFQIGAIQIISTMILIPLLVISGISNFYVIIHYYQHVQLIVE